VLYDPNDPQQSLENQFFSVWGLPAIMGGLGAFYFLVFGAVAFFTGRHLSRLGEQNSSPDSQPPVQSPSPANN
jgi:hypothetical protein